MEAILDFGRGCQDLSIILLGECVGGGGGGNENAGRLPLLSHLKGGVRRGGGERREGGINMSLYLMQPYAHSFHSIYLSYIFVLLLQPLSI